MLTLFGLTTLAVQESNSDAVLFAAILAITGLVAGLTGWLFPYFARRSPAPLCVAPPHTRC
jgi:hypothetical protein